MLKNFAMIAMLLPVASAMASAQQNVSTVEKPLAQRIAHTDPAKFRHEPALHNGAGALDVQPLFDDKDLDTNLFFFIVASSSHIVASARTFTISAKRSS